MTGKNGKIDINGSLEDKPISIYPTKLGILFGIGKFVSLCLPIFYTFVIIKEAQQIFEGSNVNHNHVATPLEIASNVSGTIIVWYLAIYICIVKKVRRLRNAKIISAIILLLSLSITVLGCFLEVFFGSYILSNWLSGYLSLTIVFLFYWFMVRHKYKCALENNSIDQ